jgi:putative endopeptidase
MSPSRPQDNFYKYVNRKFNRTVHPIPDGSSHFSQIVDMQEKVFSQLGKLTSRDNESSPFVQTFMSHMSTSSTGTGPLREVIKCVENITNWKQIPAVMYTMQSHGCPIVFNLKTSSDLNGDRELLYLDEKRRTFFSKTSRKKYVNYLFKAFKVSGTGDFSVQNFENLLKSLEKTPTELQDVKKMFNPIEKNMFTRNMRWLHYFFEQSSVNIDSISLDNPKSFRYVGKLMRTLSLDRWKTYLMFCWLDYNAMFFSDTRKIRAKAHQGSDTFQKAVKGDKEYKVRLASNLWWQDAGTQYVSHFVDKKTKVLALNICTYIFDAIETCLKTTNSMETSTRTEALKKLRNMKINIAWADNNLYLGPKGNGAQAKDTSSFHSWCLEAGAFQFQTTLEQTQEKSDPNKWREMGYHLVNACYSPECNSLYIPAAIIQPPFFFEDSIDESFAGIGNVIAHEILHAFDSQGRKVDSSGKLRNWWSVRDVYYFNKQAKKTVDLYSNHRIYQSPSEVIDGKLTLTENISDLVSLQMSWDAYVNFVETSKKRKPTNTEAKKQFFEQYAKTNLFWSTPQYSKMTQRYDPHVHPPGRTNIPLSVFYPFVTLYGVDIPNTPKRNMMYVPRTEWPRFFPVDTKPKK